MDTKDEFMNPVKKYQYDVCGVDLCKDFGKEYPANTTHTHTMKAESSEAKASYRIPINARFDLIPPIVERQMGEVYEEGAQKYGPAKYLEKPLPYSVIINHLKNHLNLWISGDRTELHLAKAIWGLATLIVLDDLTEKGYIETQNDVSLYGTGFVKAMEARSNGK